jgi:hypothetical protein
MKSNPFVLAKNAPNVESLTQEKIEIGIASGLKPVPSALHNLFWKYGAEYIENINKELNAILTDSGISANNTTNQLLPILLKFKQNFLDNGGMQVYQRASAYTLAKDVYGFSVDRWAGMATGTAVSAGTLTQETASTLNNSGFAVKFSGATLTGTGILYLRQRIASQDAKKLKNQSVAIQFKVKHDVGSAINYTIFARKADADNDFTTATNISNSGAISVATATDTIIKYENVALGDCSNGLEIEVRVECGAITTKNFEVSNAKLEIGSICTDFIDNSFANEFERCKFYFLKITGATGNISNNTLYGSLCYNFAINMIKIPVITLNSVTVYEINNTAGNSITSIRYNYSNTQAMLLEVNLGWTGLAYREYLQDGGTIFANSEL